MTQTEPTPAEADLSFAQAWDALAPGERANRGTYSVYKTREESLLISYRPETLDPEQSDLHLEIPAALMALLAAATEGKLSKTEMLTTLLKLRGGLGGFGA